MLWPRVRGKSLPDKLLISEVLILKSCCAANDVKNVIIHVEGRNYIKMNSIVHFTISKTVWIQSYLHLKGL